MSAQNADVVSGCMTTSQRLIVAVRRNVMQSVCGVCMYLGVQQHMG